MKVLTRDLFEFFISLFFQSGLIWVASAARFGIYFVRYCIDIMKYLNWLKIFGVRKFSTTTDFLTNGLATSSIKVKLDHFTSL